MAYSFTADISAAQYAGIKAEWLQLLDANEGNVSTSFYLARLEFCEHIVNGNGNQGDSRLCAVLDEAGSANAMLVVTHGKAGSPDAMLKMMDLSVKPDLNLESSEIPQADLNKTLAHISAVAIVGCLELTYEQFPANELKIYTDLPLSIEFLSQVWNLLAKQPVFAKHFTLLGHGKWLVIKKNLI